MHRQLLHIIPFVLVFSFACLGCVQERHVSVVRNDIDSLIELETEIASSPQTAIDKINTRLSSCTDTTVRYQLLILKAKTISFLSKTDSANAIWKGVLSDYKNKYGNSFLEKLSNDIAITPIKYRYDNQIMHEKMLIKQQENNILRKYAGLYLTIIGVLLFATFIWIFYLYRIRKEKKIWSLQAELNSLRLDNVRNRISPHFIFNVLSREMMRLENYKDKENLNTFIHLLRRQLELADQVSISLSDELDFIQSFLSLEKESLGKDFELFLDVDTSIDLNAMYIPSMSIYILVENAVKHSLLLKDGHRKLWIRIYPEEDAIKIKVCDNGGGFKSNPQSVGTGTGFKIITRTIQLYNQYNDNPIRMDICNVDVEDSEKGCEISYIIPKEYKFIIKG